MAELSSTQLRIRFFLKIATLLIYAKIKKIQLMPHCFHRTYEQQADLYAQGRSKPGKIITNCDGYNRISSHQKWRAIDFVLVKNDILIWDRTSEYEKLGAFWKKLGGAWGGDWKLNDIYHFQD